ncbi:MAG: PriCT-2 domain-containing protein [Planctomycetaceae bacterium]
MKIEAFPKSRTAHTKKGCGGGYLRQPAKHHKRGHWSRFYGASDWMTLEESVQAYLDIVGNSPTLIPHIPEEPPKEVPPVRFTYMPSSDAGRDESLASDALRCVNPDSGYTDWLKIGQALHSEGDHLLALWIEWSAGSKDFDEAECRVKWGTFNRSSGGVKLGTLFHIAAENGWSRPKRRYKRQGEAAGVITTDSGSQIIEEELPENAVELTLDEKAVNDAVIALLEKSDDLYDSNGQLATIVNRVDDFGQERVEIHALSLSGLREIISQRVRFFQWDEDQSGDEYPAW